MANLHSDRRLGHLVFWDTHRKRIIDAIGADVVKQDLGNALIASADTPAGFTVTLVEGGASETTVTKATVSGGGTVVTTDAADNDGANIQALGEPFALSSGNIVYFRCLLQSSEATQSDFLTGLCITDTTLLGGVSDGVYFEKLDGGTGISFTVEKDSSETQADSLGTFAADTEFDLEFYWDGSTLEAFIDGASVATPALTNLPDDEELTLSFQGLTGAAASETFTLHKCYAIQIGREAAA